uniref:Secreted protein n=1 Tax=Cacopsylla melanoneura TaxID=428564 RepID=A0A8D8TKB7_9HEMI
MLMVVVMATLISSADGADSSNLEESSSTDGIVLESTGRGESFLSDFTTSLIISVDFTDSSVVSKDTLSFDMNSATAFLSDLSWKSPSFGVLGFLSPGLDLELFSVSFESSISFSVLSEGFTSFFVLFVLGSLG